MIDITEKNLVDGPLNDEELEKLIKEAMASFENLEYYAKNSLDAENEVEKIRNLINVVKGIELLEERKKLILNTVKVRDRDIKKRLLDLQMFIRGYADELNHWMNKAVSQTDKGEKITCLSAVISNLRGINGLMTMAEELMERMSI
jgi:hypothetical protein|nr:MAG TPA: hypothetical protein [Caudoviricetes sp.]